MDKKRLINFMKENIMLFVMFFLVVICFLVAELFIKNNNINKLEKKLSDVPKCVFSEPTENNDVVNDNANNNSDVCKNDTDFETVLETLGEHVGKTEIKKIVLTCNEHKIDNDNRVNSCYAMTTNYMSLEPFYMIYNLKNKKNYQEDISNKQLLEIFKLDEKEFIEFYKNKYLSLFKDDNVEYLKHIETLDKSSDEYKSSISRFNEAKNKISNINSDSIDDVILYINDNDKLEFLISNDLWHKSRPQVSWRQGDAYVTKRIVVK